MRSAVPICAVNSEYIAARYFGIGRQRIEISSRARRELKPLEIDALIAHELGHRECFHVEMNVTVIALALAIVISALALGLHILAGCALVACFAVLELLGIWSEFQADAYAMHRTSPKAVLGVMQKTLAAHPDLERRWIFKLRLRRAAARAGQGRHQ